MRAINLALKDLLQIFRDWRAALFLIFMPIAFTLLFGFAFGGFSGIDEGDPRLPVVVLNNDLGEYGLILIQMLEDSSVIRLEPSDEDDLQSRKSSVKNGESAATVIIPPGFSDGIQSGQIKPLRLIYNPVDRAGRTAQGEIEAAAMRLKNSVETARLSETQYQEILGFVSDDERDEYYGWALDKTLEKWEKPPVVLIRTSTGEFIEAAEESENAFAQ